MIKFKDRSQEFKVELGRTLDKALTNASILAEGNCVSRAPIETGHLRGSISYITRINKKTKEDIKETMDDKTKDLATKDFIKGVAFSGEAFIGTNLEYAPHIEYGTVNQKAQAFMRNGMNESKSGIKEIIKKELVGLKIEEE